MEEISFRVQGKQYTLSVEQVKEVFAEKPVILSKDRGNEYVIINGKHYNPRNALAVALGLPVKDIPVQDAGPILESLGYKLTRENESERLFEEFLRSHGLTDFERHPQFGNTAKKPDYALFFRQESILFEVKEFNATHENSAVGFRGYDPYATIRKKIDKVREQFRNLKSYCCCLVLYNPGVPLVDLGWKEIYGAMLGNIGFRIPFVPYQGLKVEEAQTTFLYGGKMHGKYDANGYPTEPSNTTISAIVVLEHFPIGRLRFKNEVCRNESESGRKLSFEEHWTMIDRARGTECDVALTQLRVVVHENPHAAKELPHIFCGPYDERYGNIGGGIERIFSGEEILRLETNTANRGDTSVP